MIKVFVALHESSRGTVAVVDGGHRIVHSMHFYDSIVVIEKRPIDKSWHCKTGTASVPDWVPPPRPRRRRRWFGR